ncbi:MAG: hypothetical protein HKN48_00485 [Flavobacteriaceae bacterium]|nr:hypothetical protein [Flavobacteriaceae bacterium]
MKKLLLIVFVLTSISCFSQRNRFRNMVERNGQIGIGTTAPDELLTVKGKIHTQEVLVDLEGAVAPDYVFEHYFFGKSRLNETYVRPTLAELEAYLEINHHLPGIPSAENMQQEGISLKELNLKLLEKIEELTLYTLEQQKEIDALKQRLIQLEE